MCDCPYGYFPPGHPSYTMAFSASEYAVDANFNVDLIFSSHVLSKKYLSIPVFARLAKVPKEFLNILLREVCLLILCGRVTLSLFSSLECLFKL